MSFESELDAATAGLPERMVSQVRRAMGLMAVDAVAFRTPVDTGRARGNWQTTAGVPAESQIDRLDPNGEIIKAEMESVLDSAKPFDVVWLSNNLHYIDVLEFGLFDPKDPGPSKDPRPGRFGEILVQGGYSKQAPQGMVALTVEELRTQFGD